MGTLKRDVLLFLLFFLPPISDVQLHYRAGSQGKERVYGQAAAATAERSGQTQPEQQTQEEVLLTDWSCSATLSEPTKHATELTRAREQPQNAASRER